MTDTTQNELSQEAIEAIELTLKTDVKTINNLLQILGDAPFAKSAPHVQWIQAQGVPQIQAAVAAKSAPATE